MSYGVYKECGLRKDSLMLHMGKEVLWTKYKSNYNSSWGEQELKIMQSVQFDQKGGPTKKLIALHRTMLLPNTVPHDTAQSVKM